MNFSKILFITLSILIFFITCSSRQPYLQKALQENRKIAVVRIIPKVKIINSFGRSISRVINNSLFENAFKSNPNPYEMSEFDSTTIDTINKNLLDKGFLPIERQRISDLLKEKKLKQLLDAGGSSEQMMDFAKIAGAESIFLGTLNIVVEEGIIDIGWLGNLIPFFDINDKMSITFSGRVTSVKDGIVLISGEKSRDYIGFKQEHINDIINRFFKDIKEID